jgi:carbon-monoxide dehydrogenase small subunit
MEKMIVNFIVNDEPVSVSVYPHETLLRVLREKLRLTSVKEGCGIGECGACTVILDGKAVNSCLVLAASAEGKTVTTTEGLMRNGKLHPLQQAFIDHFSLQCGFCTPGFLMTAKAFLDENPHPTREEIKMAISGNVCRCTGYHQIVDAIESLSSEKREQVIDAIEDAAGRLDGGEQECPAHPIKHTH